MKQKSKQKPPTPSGKPVKRRVSSKKQAESSLTSEQRHRMIAETAYFMAEARGFNGDGLLDDWLDAESIVDQQLSGPGFRTSRL